VAIFACHIQNTSKEEKEGGVKMNSKEKAFLKDYERICNKHEMRFNCQGNIEQKKSIFDTKTKPTGPPPMRDPIPKMM